MWVLQHHTTPLTIRHRKAGKPSGNPDQTTLSSQFSHSLCDLCTVGVSGDTLNLLLQRRNLHFLMWETTMARCMIWLRFWCRAKFSMVVVVVLAVTLKPKGERESRLSWFVKGAAILVGVFVGCVLGFVLRARRDTAAALIFLKSEKDEGAYCYFYFRSMETRDKNPVYKLPLHSLFILSISWADSELEGGIGSIGNADT
ncbi:unnamed protein product [Ilex paraguariensis]|uniref:Uncharacterized protein n=1 Tax=Ilex paraguariensis TaxID=185542 RepID=A0ABC8RBP5_9AQUA